MGKQRRRDRWPELCQLVEVDDGLPVNVYGQWTEQKLRFWNRYIEITTSAMVGNVNWPAGLVYVDLFAGSGVCRVEENGKRLPGSPLSAACAPKPFRMILLCEKDPVRAAACEQRIRRITPNSPPTVFCGDCNDEVREIARHLPQAALTLAFIDPQGLDVEFETVRILTQRRRVDLLILVADAVDFARNVDRVYMHNPDSKLDKFLGAGCDWRSKWRQLGDTAGAKARQFLADTYMDQLGALGYVKFGEQMMRRAKGPLYRMIYASKHEKGLEFWDKVTKMDHQGQKDFNF